MDSRYDYIYVKNHKSLENFNKNKVVKPLTFIQKDSFYRKIILDESMSLYKIQKYTTNNFKQKIELQLNDFNIYDDDEMGIYLIETIIDMSDYFKSHYGPGPSQSKHFDLLHKREKTTITEIYINKNIKNNPMYQIYFEAVTSKNNSIKLDLVADEFRTYALCFAAVKNDGNNIHLVCKTFQTYELCLEAVKNNGNTLRYVKEILNKIDINNSNYYDVF